MAHKTLIKGTAYSITGGRTKVNGTVYSIKGGRTKVKGTAYDISFAPGELVLYDYQQSYNSGLVDGAELGVKTGYVGSSTNLGSHNEWVDNTTCAAFVSGKGIKLGYQAQQQAYVGVYVNFIQTGRAVLGPVDLTRYNQLAAVIAYYSSSGTNGITLGYRATNVFNNLPGSAGDMDGSVSGTVTSSEGTKLITLDISAVTGEQYIEAVANEYAYIQKIYLTG